jgi:hypothetical protein
MRDDPKSAWPFRLPRITGIEVAAGLSSLLWLLAAVLLDRGAPDDGGGLIARVMNGLAIVLPIALIWVAASAARTARTLRTEAARLQADIDAMRATRREQPQPARAARDPKPVPVENRQDLVQRHRAESMGRPPALAPPRMAAPAAGPMPDSLGNAEPPQPALALSGPPEPAPISREEFIKALNFPDNERDREGFRTLRRALHDRGAERLIRASQDVLTLLSQDGIYMDDLHPDHAPPEVWRRFAQGERGRGIAALGGIDDHAGIALVAGRMKTDPVFRDAAHHFMRHFDRSFMAFEKDAEDGQIVDLADTRTARAFMLLGRAAGSFD